MAFRGEPHVRQFGLGNRGQGACRVLVQRVSRRQDLRAGRHPLLKRQLHLAGVSKLLRQQECWIGVCRGRPLPQGRSFDLITRSPDHQIMNEFLSARCPYSNTNTQSEMQLLGCPQSHSFLPFIRSCTFPPTWNERHRSLAARWQIY